MPNITPKTRSLHLKPNAFSCISGLFVAVCVMALVSPAGAIVTGDRTTSEISPLLESSGDWDINWDYVYKYKGCSSVAISPYWLLTAAHVADDSPSGVFTVNGTTYTPVHTVYHSNTLSQDPNHTVGADLALIRLDNPLPGYYDLYEGAAKGKDAVIIGYGYAGSVTNTYYSWSTSTSRIERWGTNRVDVESSTTFTDGMTWTSEVIRMYFKLTDSYTTPYEAGVAVWDSGGGAFVKDPTDDTWKLAGINAYVNGSASAVYSFDAVRVEKYSAWIDNILANPAYFYYPSIPGDANLDNYVDDDDLSLLLANWNTTVKATWEMGDFDYDTDVDDNDLSLLLANWNQGTPPAAMGVVPEPATIGLLAVGGLAILRRRNR